MKTWFEIFKAGTHVSANGKKKTWTTADLDHMVSRYNQGEHDAPMVIGHPTENAPAYGWVQKLKRVGERLLALPRQVEAQFAELVRDGRFPKRSISVYPDGTLRHIGFLGAQPPAIKGLRDVDFNDNSEAVIYEYSEEELPMLTVEELQARLDQETQARKDAETRADKLRQQADLAVANFKEAQVQARKKEIDDFITQGVRDGKILPAWKALGLADFMQNLEEQTATYEFAEGAEKKTQGQWFREFLSSFAEHPLFREMTRAEEDQTTADDFSQDEQEAAAMAAFVS